MVPTFFCFCSLEIELCIRGNRNIAKGESVRGGITRTYMGDDSIGGMRFSQFRRDMSVGGDCAV